MDLKKRQIELLAPKIATGVSVCLAIFKLFSGIKLSSLSLLTSGFDSVFDAFASSATYFFLKLSHAPADEDHPYGHSRIASITSLAQGVFLTILTLILANSAYQKLREPFNSSIKTEFLSVALIANITVILLCIYLTWVIKRTGSQVVAADRLHYLSDLGGYLLLLVGFYVGPYFPKYNMDSLLTFILCAFIIMGAVKIIMDSIKNLVDHYDPVVESQIKEIMKEWYPKVLGVGRVRSRKSGHLTSVDVELISCRLQTLKQVHDLAHEVESRVRERLPHVDIFIHSEPCEETTCTTDKDCKLQAPVSF